MCNEVIDQARILRPWPGMRQALMQKEWWFSYAYDREHAVYFSWAMFRGLASDAFRYLLVDLATGEQWGQQKLLRYRPSAKEGLDLQAHRPWDIAFTAEDRNGSRLKVSGGELEADLAVERSSHPFVQRDNMFEQHYYLAHFLGNRVKGTLSAGGRRFVLDTSLGYYDHCFGVVPSRTAWHWLAVQNEHTQFVSLCNYGAYAQRYTQVFHDGRWHRLTRDVSFEHDHERPMAAWRVTSPDHDIMVRPLHQHTDRVRVPPLVPFLVNLNHSEFVVEAEGVVRVNGRFVETGKMVGVMEAHHGRW